MKKLFTGFSLSQDYNFVNIEFSKDEFELSFLNGLGYNIGVLYNKLKNMNNSNK